MCRKFENPRSPYSSVQTSSAPEGRGGELISGKLGSSTSPAQTVTTNGGEKGVGVGGCLGN